MANQLPPGVIPFGSDENCTLETCPVSWSIYGYQPSLAANTTFLMLYIVAGAIHGYLGIRWRSWGFMTGMLLGCLCEIIGYAGRVIMWNNPFSYPGFMIQIICLTIAPVFFTASIYVTLSKTIVHLAPDLSRFKPQLFYWIFIPFDATCLLLQAAGGAMSTNSTGSNQTGVNISLAGLILQVVVLTIFIGFFADFLIRYFRSGQTKKFGWRLKAFFSGLTIAIILILSRCAYRVAELQDGYSGSLIKEQVPFIILEGVFVFLATLALYFGHPGLVFKKSKPAFPNSSDAEERGVPLERK
ncbi:sphingoid long-chain base transporter RSB1 [Metarhizium anisopliae]